MSDVSSRILRSDKHFSISYQYSRVGFNVLLIVVSATLGALFAYSRGQDVNFDQLNYHYYIANAFLTGRLEQDVAPAQLVHSFFSPFVYVPFVWLVNTLPPYVVGMALGAVQGLNLWLVAIIAWIVTPSLRGAQRFAMVLAAVMISAASPVGLSEIGTSMADATLSLLILSALALMLSGKTTDGRTTGAVVWLFLAGALVGASVSLKLTSAPFAIALVAASLIGWWTYRDRLIAIMTVGVGGAAGFVVAGGVWYLTMWRTFRSPFFPYFNSIFHSPDYPSGTSFFDARFVPHSLLEALAYPFRWATLQQTTAEIPFRDIRFSLLIVIGGVAVGLGALRQGWVRNVSPGSKRLIVFMAAALCIWMYVWSIQRYIVVLELLTGPAIVVALLWSGLHSAGRGWPLMAATVCLAVVCIVTVRPIDWGHIGWADKWYTVNDPTRRSEHAIYFLDDGPLAYVVPELQANASAIEVVAWEDLPSMGNTVFLRRINALLADPRNDTIVAIAAAPLSETFKRMIGTYGLKIDGPCETTPGRPSPLTWCPLSRLVATSSR